MKDKSKEFLKENWFKLGVLILLFMIWSRLGTIWEMNEKIWDQANADAMNIQRTIQDSSSDLQRSVENLEGYLDEISTKIN